MAVAALSLIITLTLIDCRRVAFDALAVDPEPSEHDGAVELEWLFALAEQELRKSDVADVATITPVALTAAGGAGGTPLWFTAQHAEFHCLSQAFMDAQET